MEPSATQQRIIAGDLNRLGVENVDVAESGSEALDKMHLIRPDLVVSSMYLPDMMGTDLVETMRSRDDLQDIPYMLISSETDIRYLEPIRQAGVVAILPKPYEQEQLRKALFTTLDFLEPDSAAAGRPALEDLRILIVDDSMMSRRHIKRIFVNLGVEHIVEAVNGREAMKVLQGEFFDLVITDYNMPEMDGHELTRYIRESSAQSSIPILMITSESDQSRLASVEQLGISAICDKPFDTSTVKRLLESLEVTS